MGNTMCIWKQVCSGIGTGARLLYMSNTVSFSMVLWVSQYQSNGHMFHHMTLLINVNNNNNGYTSPLLQTQGGIILLF